MRDVRLPRLDFVIAGAPKSGTSYLHSALMQNNSICMPDKEVITFLPQHFSARALGELREELDVRRIVGLKRPDYVFNFTAMQLLRESCGRPKIILSLRDPVVRAISHFYHLRRYAMVRFCSFAEFVEAIVEKGAPTLGPRGFEIEQHSFYDSAIENCIRLFGEENVLLANFEDLRDTPQTFVDEVCRFIGAPLVAIEPLTQIPQEIIYNERWQELWAKASRVEGICNDEGVVLAKRSSLTQEQMRLADSYREAAVQHYSKVKPNFPKEALGLLRTHYSAQYDYLEARGVYFSELTTLTDRLTGAC